MAQVNLGRVVGYSAYEVAVQEGFVGTEQEWLASLKGDTGNTGPTGADGDDGTTFTPSVSAEGVISWTNNGGKVNPPSVNIKGPQGIQGPQGPTGPAGTYTAGTGINISNGELSVDTTTVAMKSDLGDELPPIASGDAGKVLKVNAGETAVEWAVDASQTYTAGTGIDITNNEISVDNTVAMKSDIPAAELPNISVGDAGKVLKVNSLETGVEWGTDASVTYTAGTGIDITSNVISSTVNGVPSASGASEGDVLTVDGRGEINWAAPSGGGSYSAGDGIVIDENDEISVDYANLDGDKIGNIVDAAWGFGKQNYMVWDGELDADCECQSNDNIYEFDFANCEDDIIGDIGSDTVTLGWAGSEEVGDNTVYTWTDDYNTLEAIYVTGTNNFVSMDLVADSSTYQEHDWFEFRVEVINEIPAEFLQIDGTSIVNDRGNLSVDEDWVEDIVENIVNPPVNLLRVNIGVQGGDAVIDTNGSSYEMELTVEDKYFVAIVDAELGEALSTQNTYNYFVNTSAGNELKMSISPTWAEIAGGPAGIYTFTGDDSMVQFAVESDDATTATVRVFFNKPAEPTELPPYSSGDAGKALKVDNSGELEWATVGGGTGIKVIEINQSNNGNPDLTSLSNDDNTYIANAFMNGFEDYPFMVKYNYNSGRGYAIFTIADRFQAAGVINDNYWFHLECPEYLNGAGSKVMWIHITYAEPHTVDIIDVYNSYIASQLAGKQNTLTAGTGISISGSTISATQELPALTNNASKVLAVNSQASGVEWINQGRAMPGDPANDGDYKLVNTVESGMSVLSWEEDSGGGGGSVSDPIQFESTHEEGDPYNYSYFGNDMVQVGYDEYGSSQSIDVYSGSLNFSSLLSNTASISLGDEPLQDGQSTEGRLTISAAGGAVIIDGLRLYDSQTGSLYDITVNNGVLTATLWEDPTEPPVE